MSNRRKPKPPARITAIAKAYACGHCDADVGKPRLGDDGAWHIPVRHDDTCPVLTGAVSRAPAARRAIQAATR